MVGLHNTTQHCLAKRISYNQQEDIRVTMLFVTQPNPPQSNSNQITSTIKQSNQLSHFSAFFRKWKNWKKVEKYCSAFSASGKLENDWKNMFYQLFRVWLESRDDAKLSKRNLQRFWFETRILPQVSDQNQFGSGSGSGGFWFWL